MRFTFYIVFVSIFSACTTTNHSGYSGFGIDSLSKEKLSLYAPPQAAGDLKNQIEKLIDIRSPSSSFIANDGQSLFTMWNVTGSNQIWKIKGAKNFPIQITSGEDRSVISELSPNNKWLAFTRDSKGDENYGVYLMNLANGSMRQVYYNPKQKTEFLGFSDDSLSVFYSTNDKAPSSNSIYKFNIASGKQELILDETGLWQITDIKGDKAILTLNKGSMSNEHYLFDFKSKIKSPLIGQNESEDFTVLFTNKEDEYLVLTNKIDDFRQIYLFKKGKLNSLLPKLNMDVSSMQVSADRKKLAYSVNNKGFFQTKVYSISNKTEVKIPTIPNASQTILGHFSKNSRYLTLETESHNSPRKSFVFDLQNKNLQEWTEASTPEVSDTQFVKPSLEYYKASDGTDIPMFVWRSEKCQKEACPVIVSFHGGPESQFTPKFAPLYSFYTQRGFIFVAPNVRGSDGYGKKWLHADDGVKRLNVITDIRDASRFIKKTWTKNGIVPKVGITGGSYGGYSTLVGMSLFAEDYDAGVAIVGMSNLITFIENTAPYRRALRMNEYGDPSKNREDMLKLSPVSYINKVNKPLMILHGATDPRVPVGEAVQYFEKVQNQNPNDKLVIFPDEGHGVAKRPNIVLSQSYILDFFEKHLK